MFVESPVSLSSRSDFHHGKYKIIFVGNNNPYPPKSLMKLLRKSLEKDKSGFVSLQSEEAEDLWHVYNILFVGDQLQCSTVRKVVSESDTGSTDKSSVRITLQVKVEKIDFDPIGGVLRVNGRNMTESKHIKMGAYHTLELELHRPFTITKSEWDSIAIDRIQEACDVASRADIAAIVLQEGLAQICLVTEYMTIVRSRVELSIPKKRSTGASQHDKSLSRFFDLVMDALLANVNFEVVKVLIVASPGFVKDTFFTHMMEAATKSPGGKVIRDNKSKIVLAHCSSGHKHALQEVLQLPAMQSRLSNTKYAGEVAMLNKFHQTLAVDSAKAFYGLEFVSKAAERAAIDTLLVTDTLFRSNDIRVRKLHIQLVDQVKELGGKVMIFSSLHPSGEQLSDMTGVAALLKYPLPDVEQEVQVELERKEREKLGKLAPRPGDGQIAVDSEPVYF